ncbi:MAG: helix-turn-helix domain-containing protein [Cyanobacteria bacterium SBLK]|nr:helix-turn-helix domain-containing protein [Cyanobacteria bacterium SBLK]
MPIIVVLPISRRNQHLTQEKLAQLSHRSQQLIGKLEQGKAKGIGFDTLSQLCDVTGQDIGNILTYVSNDPRKTDEEIYRISRQLHCSTEEVIPYLPEDLKRKYRRLF